MKVRVRNTFRDKITRVLLKKNTELEISEERFAEINGTEAGFLVEAITDTKPPEEKGETLSESDGKPKDEPETVPPEEEKPEPPPRKNRAK